MQTHNDGLLDRSTYVVTGPTSGMGRLAALSLAEQSDLILIGRNQQKLNEMVAAISRKGGDAIPVVCDLSDFANVERAVAAVIALGRPIAGLLNNAGMIERTPAKNALGWDMTFAANFLGPFALTEALIPSLVDGATVLFVVSTVEDPNRNPGKAVGYRGGRYISAEASARGEWLPAGSKKLGADAYATAKQCSLAAAMALGREVPRLRFNAVTPGLVPATGLLRGDKEEGSHKVLASVLVPLLMPFVKFLNTPEKAAHLLERLLLNGSGQTCMYYDARGNPTSGSDLVQSTQFQERVILETRALLAQARLNEELPTRSQPSKAQLAAV